ncbi:hypothetical protein KY284_028992 [Solanum tuberosum]|nr:hypothetical protein KY284_028992 [Solanum tuberosum]
MAACSPVYSPMQPASKLSSTFGVLFNDPSLYCSTVGALQYLTFTRPDVAYVVNKVSQFMNCPLDVHWIVVKCILCYVKAIASHDLFFNVLQITCFTDILIWIEGGEWEMWMIENPPLVLLYFLVITLSHGLHGSNELSLGCFTSTVPILWCDNLSATYLTANPIFYSLADVITKPLSKSRFLDLRNKLTVVQHPAQLEGE